MSLTTWYLVEDVAQIAQVHPRTVQRWCRERKIPHFRIGRSIRFTEDQIRDIERICGVEPAPTFDVNAPNPSYSERLVEVPAQRDQA